MYIFNDDIFNLIIKILDFEDISKLYSYGFNIVRLGIMWPGVEPFENKINNTYLKIMKEIVSRLDNYNISVVLDFHQDLLSNYFCGEGVPN